MDLENEKLNNNNNEKNNSTSSQGKKNIYVISLELEDGSITKIKIYSDQDKVELSRQF